MRNRLSVVTPFAAALLILAAGCLDQVTAPTIEEPSFAKSKGELEPAVMRVVEQVNAINAQFEAAGQSIRLDYPWLFTVGRGTDPFARLRTGSRWPQQPVNYILDVSDYTGDVDGASVDAALQNAFETWNQVTNTSVELIRGDDDGGNFDVLDGSYDGGGNCVFLYDVFSPNLDLGGGFIYPESDIVVGGWVNPSYFASEDCLGSANIIGVTWTWSSADQDGDQYQDILYVEQFYNPAFQWTTSESVYLDWASPTDIETIAVHENGHALGLDHFGGPVNNQPFKLQPNGKVFNPTAVMNPYYLQGERRELLATDMAALRTLYTGHR